MPPRPPLRVAFLISQHPAINHALLMREVCELRRQGMEILTASISDPDRPIDQLTPDEQQEASTTFYVKRQGLAGAGKAFFQTLLTAPAGLARGFGLVWRLAGADLRKGLYLTAYFLEALILGCWLKQQAIAHLHVQYSSTVGLLLAATFPIELSISFHGPDEFLDPKGFFLREKIAACRFVRSISYYARSQIMTWSPYSEWSKVQVAYLGVDPQLFSTRPFRANPDRFEILCVGRLAPVKAQHILVDAMRLLVDRKRPVLLHIVGGGGDRTSIEAHVARLGLQEHIVVHGFTHQDKLDRLYRQTDIFALPSFSEGVPGVLMEAMAMEIPCVATRITGVPELIGHGVDGLLVTPSDPAALAAAIEQLILDTALREQMGRAARRKIQTRFHLETNAITLREIFETYLTRPDRSSS